MTDFEDPYALWDLVEGDYFFISTKSKSGRWKDHPIKRGQWSKADDIIDKHRDCDIYFCPHGFTQPKRLKEYSIDPKFLYSDLDEANPREIHIRPTIAVESSPGRFVGYWLTDKPVDEEVNRRLAYSIGADISGWDRTQVLRVPRTRNYKYKPAAKVKLLWSDGPKYRLKSLLRLLPEVPDAGPSGEDSDNQALKIYAKYENLLSRFARKELLNGNPRTGSRSEVLWRLQGELIELGLSTEETFILLWASPWNKFRGRRGGEDQLRRELDKQLARRIQGNKKPEKKTDSEIWDPGLTPAVGERKNVDWVIPGMLARGVVTIIEGNQGSGKSYLMQMIAGHIVDGKRVPLVDQYKPKVGRVAYFDPENDMSTATIPRLIDNGVKNRESFFQGEKSFSITDLDRLQTVIDQLDELRPELVVFDTINTFIGQDVDVHRSNEAQAAMDLFKEIATRYNCAVAILRHLRKSGGAAIHQGMGSGAIAGAARIIAMVRDLKDGEGGKLVTCTKCGVGPHFRSFTYNIIPLPDKDGAKGRSKFMWGEFSDMLSDDEIKQDEEKGESPMKQAQDMLEKELEKNGRVNVNKFLKKASGRSIHKGDVYRAAEALELRKDIQGGERWWSR